MTTSPSRVTDAASIPTVPLRGAVLAGVRSAGDGSGEVGYAFSDRSDGTMSSSVGEGDHGRARARLAEGLGVPADRVGWMHQVHGNAVVLASGVAGHTPDQDGPPVCDGIVETRPGHGVAVLVADCLPVLLAVPGGVAAAHAGREGLLAGVLTATVERLMDATGAPAGAVTAVIGPAIGGCCYEVGEALADRVDAAMPGTRSMTTWGTPSVDLVHGAVDELRGAGLRDISRAGGCTRCGGGGRWFSHRASGGTDARPEGRQAGVAVLRTGDPR